VPAEQLELPLAGTQTAHLSVAKIPRNKRVFVNRSLKMSAIDWVGFDMDYTLAIYRQSEMDRVSVRHTVHKLVARGYPAELLELDYPLELPIRGLLIDKKHGHVLKLDRFKHVQKGFHGLRRLGRDELRALYQSKRVRTSGSRFHWVDTLYALSEVAVYVKVIEQLEAQGRSVDYGALFEDIRECIDEAHRDGSILDEVAADLPRFVDRDPLLASTLHKLRSAGKRLFLLTNSGAAYTDKMMSYLLGGAMAEYPSYRHYFDAIVVAARKPAFFTEGQPLLSRTVHGTRPASIPLERGAIHEGGNLHDLERALGTTGDRILYVGDHIYGDILRSRRESAWRTALILQEMEGEVAAIEACKRESDLVSELHARREELEDQLRFVQARFKDLSRQMGELDGETEVAERALIEAERQRTKRSVERIRGQMRAIDAQVDELDRAIDACFHPYWGSLMRESDDRSCFGDQVEDYACLYTSRVSNLSAYSPLQHFRSARDRMPHEQ
jgi:HAD superfamily 5'-nucleotidase-like hydrolase